MIELKNPVHPGDVLKHDVVEAHELTVGQAAKVLKVGHQALSAVLNGKAAVTPEMALRFEKAFGIDTALLVRMQADYEVAQVRRRHRRAALPAGRTEGPATRAGALMRVGRPVTRTVHRPADATAPDSSSPTGR